MRAEFDGILSEDSLARRGNMTVVRVLTKDANFGL